MPTVLITGATGFVGSHAADAFAAAGYAVRALARPTADLAHLRTLAADVRPGDVTDAAAVAAAMDGCDAVVHAAAKVGDWGPVEAYRPVNVTGLENVLVAARAANVRRVVHVSSLGVYAARHHYGTDEGEPLPDSHFDSYTLTKVEAERLALRHVREFGLPVVILRPGFVYGPRDRTVLPRLAKRLRENDVTYVGRGRTALNTTFAGNIAAACVLAARHPAAAGQVFNITDGEFVTKRRFFEAVADALELPRPRKNVPLFVARMIARVRERKARRSGSPTAPKLTLAMVKFAGLNLDFSIAKARTELGYAPPTPFADGIRLACEWSRLNTPGAAP